MRKKFSKKVSFLVALVMMLSSFGTSAFANFSVGELIQNNTFTGGVGLPWHVVESLPGKASFEIENGVYTVTPTVAGDNTWDIQLRHRGLTMEQGHTYNIKFTVKSTKNCKIRPKVGDMGLPYAEDWFKEITLTANVPQTINETFKYSGATRSKIEWAFHLGGTNCTSALPYSITFDNMYLSDAQFLGYPDILPEPTNGIRVNQEGYFPNLAKVATLKSSSTSPVAWQLKNSAGTTVAQGNSTVVGADHSSGDDVHTIDFSSYTTKGTGYTLVAGTSVSMPFNIGDDIYTKMKYDSIKYFYHNRSAIPIIMPYADRQDLTRDAGHPNDVLAPDPTKDYKASYTLDVTGGWYDAGDHGKYVVNGGISTWTVMNEYERALYLGDATKKPYADNTMNIPESGNTYPDLLDETRYNLKTLLKMQVPAGNTLAGMVHHKAHDERWTALAVKPSEDTMKRYLQPPSTAATLNLAAIAAQGSRLWKQYDATFAATCLTTAETAWDAAVAHPAIYATMEQGAGGGAYGDNYVLDDFYWAASELYVTTGKAKYLDYIKASPHYLKMPSELTGGEDQGLTGCFDWGNTAGMGTISLALVPNNLTATEVATAKSNIKLAADKFISIEKAQGYGVPVEEKTLVIDANTTIVGFPWGSNSFVVNNAICMAYAYDFSKDSSGKKDTKYLSGVTTAMDYILGRNPNVQSYVTGYGENPLENPHHRFWAYQADNSFPKAPAGCMSGGPNSGLQDPWVKGSGWRPGVRAGELSFMDNIESWSTNEITINWNAPLAWVSAYLDEQGPLAGRTSPSTIGDVNKDGNKDAIDFALVKKYLLTQDGTGLDLVAADVNGDKTIDAIDFAIYKQYLLGVITKFPAEV